jgi:ribosome-binding protein aMBF1 (putative translation factor)
VTGQEAPCLLLLPEGPVAPQSGTGPSPLDRTRVHVVPCFYMNTDSTLGQRIREARDGAGLSQRQLADKIGATVRSVSWWENGDRMPDLVFFAKIAEATGVSIDWLYTGADPCEAAS